MAIGQLGGRPPGGGVRLGEVSELLEGGQLVADGGRAHVQAGRSDQGLAPYRLAGPDVLANQCGKNALRPICGVL